MDFNGNSIDNDVTPPASSTTNAIARYADTTGKVIKNSTVLISDAGVIEGISSVNGFLATLANTI